MSIRTTLAALAAALGLLSGTPTAPAQPTAKPVRLIAEAEDFALKTPPTGAGWRVMPYRENYFASTFAITFLSRMACLSAPEQVPPGQQVVAEQTVNIPADGSYFVMARYEQPFNFSVEFTVEVLQDGKTIYSKPYGRLQDDKVWPLNGHVRKPMERFFWGGTDNIVWQYSDAAPLKAGKATIRLIAAAQMDGGKPRLNAAKRNVDVVCLTNDTAGMAAQKGSRYLEFDGWLTQEGDLFARVTNRDAKPVAVTLGPDNLGQHSPYYIHVRDWTPVKILRTGYAAPDVNYQLAGPHSEAVAPDKLTPRLDATLFTKTPEDQLLAPGQQSGWAPIGGMIDALHNSDWSLTPPAKISIEFGTPDGHGGVTPIKKLDIDGPTTFEMPGVVAPNATLSKQLESRGRPSVIRTRDEALAWLLGEVKKFPSVGTTPERFYIYNIGGFGGTPSYPDGIELMKALGDNTATFDGKRGLVAHWRDTSIAFIDAKVKALGKGDADAGWKSLYIVSYGDETHLPSFKPSEQEFADFLKARNVKTDGPAKYTEDRKDPLFYYSQLCAKEKGGHAYAEATAYYLKHGVYAGANYSPHSNYMVTEMDYIRTFKIGAMSMPWAEDYVWQIPEFSVQATGYLTAAFRAGAKYHDNPIHMYVMPHSPGNTPRDFRLSFYQAVGNGAKMINYFCASPLVVGGTENYVATDDLPMWRAIHDATHEAGAFEDYVMDGHVRHAKVGLLLSSVEDVLSGSDNTVFAMQNNERKAAYYALRHAQVPVDFLSEDDVIDGLAKDYKVIYVTQTWLHSRVIAALNKWVKNGGTLVSFAGGGFRDEFDKPNPDTAKLYGVKSEKVDEDPDLVKKYLLDGFKPFLSKQDLPLYTPIDTVDWTGDGSNKKIEVIVWRQRLTAGDGRVLAKFSDGSTAAVETKHGKGRAVLIGFLPGQAYLKSGLPVRPADRGGSDDAFTHFLPTAMDVDLRRLIVDQFLPKDFQRPVECSETLVESTCIDTPALNGKPARTAVTLMNFTGKPIATLTVKINGVDKATSVRSMAHGELKPEYKDGAMTVTLPIDTADMVLIDR
ncbi:MAG: hypothetical protein K8S99_09620 [Planctomycetes bacterium]|nr:hypothetical protein [Planctomycetota bacterium]